MWKQDKLSLELVILYLVINYSALFALLFQKQIDLVSLPYLPMSRWFIAAGLSIGAARALLWCRSLLPVSAN